MERTEMVKRAETVGRAETVDVRVQNRVSAYAIAVEEDRLLLARLSDASPVFRPGLWHLPGGGIDPGEQPVEALGRELREETGLELTTAQLLDARTYAAQRRGVSWHLTALFYAVGLRPGAPSVTEIGGSTEAAVWTPVADLHDSALSPPTADALRLFVPKIRSGSAGHSQDHGLPHGSGLGSGPASADSP
ncbi:NUDIX hydrolase [Streptomyces lydicus]|uniref:NUDIX hydrolase n=1 Tax=Streptomyces lydicus TaxID=47763 RepID=UPI001F504F6B|nr:NUDIX domain-containing protein [Streptomyces lydicus]MCZ1006415.1 NUDIX domain-containing protein [Streptomyces lydicus]